MKSIQHKRRESILFQEISIILSEKIKNANISYVTVTDVELANDRSVLKIYVTFESNKDKSLKHLNHTKGFVKFQLAKLKDLRKVPEIIFKLDKTADKGKRIDEIIKKIKNKD